jgi:hypothetical protein
MRMFGRERSEDRDWFCRARAEECPFSAVSLITNRRVTWRRLSSAAEDKIIWSRESVEAASARPGGGGLWLWSWGWVRGEPRRPRDGRRGEPLFASRTTSGDVKDLSKSSLMI